MSISPNLPKADPKTVGTPSTPSTTKPDQPQEDTTKMVFIGNLSYQTRESELQDLCEKIGKVSITKIVFRGPRSQGFGFVTFEKESDVGKAVEKLKDSDFDGRKINVERVLPRSERPARESEGSFRGERGGFRGRGGRFASRRSRPAGPPSTTVVYIGNLPFNAVDKDLENIFSEYPIVSARVVYRPDGRSRGFGFVTLADEAAQKRAIADLAGAECDGRALVIRAAVSEEHSKKADEEKDEE